MCANVCKYELKVRHNNGSPIITSRHDTTQILSTDHHFLHSKVHHSHHCTVKDPAILPISDDLREIFPKFLFVIQPGVGVIEPV